MKQFKSILAATDTRLDDHPIIDEAAEIARQNKASLKIVDSVPEFSWTTRLVMKDHERLRDLIAREKQAKLDALAAPIRDRGVDVETKVLWGKTSVEVIREVLRSRHDLVLRVAKGNDSRREGYFGTTGVRLLRECPCAVWLVAPATVPEYEHVLGCVDTSTGDELDAELNHKVYKLSSLVSQHYGARLSIIHAWSVFGDELLRYRLAPTDHAAMMRASREQVEGQLDEFLQTHGSSVRERGVHVIHGDAPAVIPEFAREQGVDLVVIGTVARSGAVGMIIGNTAEQILNRIECSVLALKPDAFVSPITLGDYINPVRTG